MPTQKKLEQVALLEERLGRATITIGLDYRHLSVTQMQELRRTLREKAPDSELRVIKNTMLARAAENAGQQGVTEIVDEATALLFGFAEIVEPPKALRDYLRESRLEIPIRGGFLDGDVLSGAQVTELADVPSHDDLMGLMAGGLNSPIRGIAAVLHGMIRDIAAIVEARAAQIEEQDGGGAVAEPSDEAPEAATAEAVAPEAEGADEAESATEDAAEAEASDDAEPEAGAEGAEPLDQSDEATTGEAADDEAAEGDAAEETTDE